ncbi:hypothetical protein FPANT_8559 [Fusarium pseudoanthophilum]|uniref:Uncharacterized protein n=1 Tax=Fusarium pseudoanthophilum TaxID=48495 RepID=A0A8H5NZ90_9HYPO|nr:hypothetical protein FPANT_8559 [Fusarium pseudoanthophilum]
MAGDNTPGRGGGRSRRSKRAAGEGPGGEEPASSSSRQRPDTPTPIGGSRHQTPVPLPQVPGSSSRPPVARPGAPGQPPVTTPGSRGPVPRVTGSTPRSSNIPVPTSTVRSQAGGAPPGGATFTGSFSGPRSVPPSHGGGGQDTRGQQASGLTPSNSGQSLHRLAVTGSAGRRDTEQSSPGTPSVGAQETVPSAFWKPSRDNLIKLQYEPNPEFKWDNVNKRCVIVGAPSNSTLELDASIMPEPNLPPGATAEETAKLKYYVSLMLFCWHSNRFVGFYARLVNSSLATNSERFIMIINTMKDKFKTEKSHFLWRYAYGWVLELAENHPELLDMLDDVSAANQANLTNALLARLDATSFNAVFHHVRHRIDFNRTRDRSDQQGHYFIKTVFLNLVTGLLKIWQSERRMNLGTETDDNGNFKLKAKPGTPWGLLEEFKYVDESSFAKLAQEFTAPGARPAVDVVSARRELVLPPGPPPPPPPPSMSRHSSPGADIFGGDGAGDSP